MRRVLPKEECPFCHAQEAIVKRWGKMNLMFVACKACKACGPAKAYTEDAVNAWNAAKRRCDALPKQAEVNPMSASHSCSECGRALIVDSAVDALNYRFCPGCGAEINQPRLF